MRNSHPFLIMVNAVGGEPPQLHLRVVQEALFVECASLHPCGKRYNRPERRTGNVIVLQILSRMEPDFCWKSKTKSIRPIHASSVILFDVASLARRIQVQLPLAYDQTMRSSELPGLQLWVSAHRPQKLLYSLTPKAASKGLNIIRGIEECADLDI